MRRKIKRENNCFKKSFSIILTIIFIALIAYVSYNKIIKYQKEKEKFQEETEGNRSGYSPEKRAFRRKLPTFFIKIR